MSFSMWDVAERAWESRAKACAQQRAVDGDNASAPRFPTSIFSRRETELPHTPADFDFSKYEDPLALRRDVMLRRWRMEVESLSLAQEVARRGAAAEIDCHVPTTCAGGGTDVEQQGDSRGSFIETKTAAVNWSNSTHSIAAAADYPINSTRSFGEVSECRGDKKDSGPLDDSCSSLHKQLEDLLQSSKLLRASASEMLVTANSSSKSNAAASDGSTSAAPQIDTRHAQLQKARTVPEPVTTLPTPQLSEWSRADSEISEAVVHETNKCRHEDGGGKDEQREEEQEGQQVGALDAKSSTGRETETRATAMTDSVLNGSLRDEAVQPCSKERERERQREGESKDDAVGIAAGDPAGHPTYVPTQDDEAMKAIIAVMNPDDPRSSSGGGSGDGGSGSSSSKKMIQSPRQELLRDGPFLPTDEDEGSKEVDATRGKTPPKTKIKDPDDHSVSNSYSDAFSEGTGGSGGGDNNSGGGDGSYSVAFSSASSAGKGSYSAEFSDEHMPEKSENYPSYEENSYSEAFSDLGSPHYSDSHGLKSDGDDNDKGVGSSDNYSDAFSSPEKNAASYSDAFSDSSEAHDGNVHGATKVDDDTYSEAFSESHGKEDLPRDGGTTLATDSYSDGFSDNGDDRNNIAAEGNSADNQYAASSIDKTTGAGNDSYSEVFPDHSNTNEPKLLEAVVVHDDADSDRVAQNNVHSSSTPNIPTTTTTTPFREDSPPRQLENPKAFPNCDQPIDVLDVVAAPEVEMSELMTQSGDVSLARTAWEQAQQHAWQHPAKTLEKDNILGEDASPLNRGTQASPTAKPASATVNEAFTAVTPSVIFPIPIRHFQELLVQHCVTAAARARQMLLSHPPSGNMSGQHMSNRQDERLADRIPLEKVQQSLVALASCSVAASLYDESVLSTTQGPSSLALQLAASDAWIAVITEERDTLTSSPQSAPLSMATQLLRDLSVVADQLIFRSHARVSAKELVKLSFGAVSAGGSGAGSVARFPSVFLGVLLGLRFFSDLPQLRAIVRQCEDRDVAVLAKAVAIVCSQNMGRGRDLFLDMDLEAIFARLSSYTTTDCDVQSQQQQQQQQQQRRRHQEALQPKTSDLALAQRIVAVAVFAVVHCPTVRGAICMCLHDETNLPVEDEAARLTAAFVAATLSQNQPGIFALAAQKGRQNSSHVLSGAEDVQAVELFKFQQILLWHLSVYNNDL